jgi:hypothetical protein
LSTRRKKGVVFVPIGGSAIDEYNGTSPGVDSSR